MANILLCAIVAQTFIARQSRAFALGQLDQTGLSIVIWLIMRMTKSYIIMALGHSIGSVFSIIFQILDISFCSKLEYKPKSLSMKWEKNRLN